MLNVDYIKLRQEIDVLITGYRLQEAVEKLKALDFMSIPPKLRADYSRLARRAHLYKEAIKILQDRVYGVPNPEPADVMEYASSIRKLGMVHQCLHLLDRIPEHKEKSLYKAFCYVHQWDYAAAKLEFENYLLQGGLNEREALVAQLNLISCDIFLENWHEAEKSLNAIEPLCRESYLQFYLNCQEMRGQISIKQQRLMEASALLARAHDVAKKEIGSTTLFIEKWKLIAELPIPSAQPKDAAVQAFRKTIRLQGHWETLRDFDYHVAMMQKDQKLLQHVYFGTPFMGFKKRIQKHHPGQIGDHYIWGHSQEKVLDPLDTAIKMVPYGLIQHRLLLVLLSDFYRPWSLQRIFDELFPTEIYDVESSPKRIYGLIKKLQDSIKELQLPFEVQSTIHGYRFRVKEQGAVLLYPQMSFSSHEQIVFGSLKEKYHLNEFTAQEMAQCLAISSHKAYRWVQELEQAGLIVRPPKSKKFSLKAA